MVMVRVQGQSQGYGQGYGQVMGNGKIGNGEVDRRPAKS